MLSEETKNNIIDHARFSPTGDNSQHWGFKWKGDELCIYYIPERAKHVLNQGLYSSYLALGCLLELLSVYARANALEIKEQVFEEERDILKAKVRFEAADNTVDDGLAGFIKLRSTNRRKYENKKIPEAVWSEIQQQCQEYPVDINLVSKFESQLENFLIDCEHYIWKNNRAFLDTTKWIRYTDKEYRETKDGFNLKNILLKKIEGVAVKVFRRSSRLKGILYHLFLKFKVKADAKRTFKNTGGFLYVSSSKNSNIDFVNCGKAFYRSWLILTKHGYQAQPLTTASLLPCVLEMDGKLEGSNPKFQSIFETGYKYLKKVCPGDDLGIVWMMRVGKAERLEDSARTLRLNLDQVMHPSNGILEEPLYGDGKENPGGDIDTYKGA